MTSRPNKSVLIVELKCLPTGHLDPDAGFTALGVAATTFVTSPQTLAEHIEKRLGGEKWYTSPLESALTRRPLLCAWVCACFRQPQFEHWVPADHVFYFDTFMEKTLPDYYPDASRRSFLPLAADLQRYKPLCGQRRASALLFIGNVSLNRAATGLRRTWADHGFVNRARGLLEVLDP